MADLITSAQWTARTGRDLTGTEQTQLEALISDASALVVSIVNDATVTDSAMREEQPAHSSRVCKPLVGSVSVGVRSCLSQAAYTGPSVYRAMVSENTARAFAFRAGDKTPLRLQSVGGGT